MLSDFENGTNSPNRNFEVSGVFFYLLSAFFWRENITLSPVVGEDAATNLAQELPWNIFHIVNGDLF